MKKNKYDVKESLGYWLSRSSRLVEHFFIQELKKHNITPASYCVLNCINTQLIPNAGDIAAYLEYDKAFVSRILDKLEKDNLIKRTLDENDRRYSTVSMTSKGKNLLPKLIEISNSTNKKIKKILTTDEANTLHSILNKIGNSSLS